MTATAAAAASPRVNSEADTEAGSSLLTLTDLFAHLLLIFVVMEPGDLFEALGMVRLLAKTLGDLDDDFDLGLILGGLLREGDTGAPFDVEGADKYAIGVGECDEEVE